MIFSVKESKKWYGKQPGHMVRADSYTAGDYFGKPFRKVQQAYWVRILFISFQRI